MFLVSPDQSIQAHRVTCSLQNHRDTSNMNSAHKQRGNAFNWLELNWLPLDGCRIKRHFSNENPLSVQR